jgi:glycosyltransferase involved in cell wall biosynthesis
MMVLAKDHSTRSDFGKRAREKLVSEYSLEKHCEGLLDIYRELYPDDDS